MKKGVKLYVEGVDKKIAAQFSKLVSNPEDADHIILKLSSPYDPRDTYLLERFFRQGRLDFTEDELTEHLELINTKPTTTIINLERPAVIPEINSATQGLIADFDCSDAVILELIFGKFRPSGKLPFELPSSIEAVENQKEDVPYDSKDPLYNFGSGLRF